MKYTFRRSIVLIGFYLALFSRLLFADIHMQLIEAVKSNSTLVVVKLLEKGAFVNVLDEKYGTPLYMASKRGYSTLVTLLLKAGANINRGHANGETPLMIAMVAKKENIFRILMSHNPNLILRTSRGSNLLMYAAAFGRVELLKSLLKSGIKINELDTDGDSALHYCVGTNVGKNNCSLKIFKFLVSSGADINLKSRRIIEVQGKRQVILKSVLEYAAQYGRLGIVKYLVERKSVKMTSCQKTGHNALQQSVYYNRLEVAQYLLKKQQKTLKNSCIFNAIVARKNRKISKTIKLILTKTYFRSLSLYRQNELITLAVSQEQIDYLKHLVKIGIIDRSIFTKFEPRKKLKIIMAALSSNSNAMLESMFKAGIVDTNTRVKGRTLIDYTVETGRESAYAYLFSRGIFPAKEILGDYIRRVVFRHDRSLSQSVRLKILNKLARSGVSGYIDESTGDTFLTLAYKYNDLSLAEYVISKHKEYVNKANKEGNTPLMLASRFGNTRLLRMLLKYGANPSLANRRGKSSLLIALDAGKGQVANIILWTGKYDVSRKVYLKQVKAKVALSVYALAKKQTGFAYLLVQRQSTLSEQEASQLLYLSIRYKYETIYKMVIAKKAAINVAATPFVVKKYAIDLAIEYFRTGILVNLLRRKAKFYTGMPNSSHLMRLVAFNRTYMLKLLLARGLDINQNHLISIINDKVRMSMLNYSLSKRNYRVTKFLLKAKADPNVWDSKGRTAIFYANRRKQVVTLLLAGANPNHEDKRGQTALSIALEQSNIKLVKILLTLGANPNYGYSKAGATNIMIATWNEDIAVIHLLLNRGANPELPPSNSRLEFQNAYKIADKSGNQLIKNIFRTERLKR